MLMKKIVKTRHVVEVTFEVPQAELPKGMTVKTIKLVGEFNDWDETAVSMTYHKNDKAFRVTIELEPGREYQFRYLLNDGYWIVSFGTLPEAQAWLEETCTPFRLLLDPDRETYRAFGLQRSLLRSWNIKTVWRYAQLLTAGRRWRGIQGDSAQLGGDFIVDRFGVVRPAYPSRDPTDRPAVDDLLAALHQVDGA
jgi:peroxiredoxin